MSSTNSDTQSNNYTGVIIFLAITLAVLVALAANYLITTLPDFELGIVMGVVVTLGIVVVTAGVLSGFVIAYSILRRKEESEDDKRELEMLRAVTQMRGNQTIKLESPQQANTLPWRVEQGQLPPQIYDEMGEVVFE